MQSAAQPQNDSKDYSAGKVGDYQVTNPAVQNMDDKKRSKIMVVEDETDAREMFVEMLQANDQYEVSSAVDGVDALAKIEAEKGQIDLILLDIVMPRLDGIDTLRKIRTEPEKYGNPVVVMLTNLGGDIAENTTDDLHAQGYLMKIETEPAQLLKAVEEHLSKKGVSTPKPAPEASKVIDASDAFKPKEESQEKAA